MMKSDSGLTSREVEEQRKKYGSNSISIKKSNKFINILIASLSDPIIKILLIALSIKVIFLFSSFDWYETIGIVIAIFVASFISSISEYGSEKAFIKLQEEASKIKCRVKRDGKLQEISIDDVVVGDIISLEVGDKIPADGYLVSGELTVDESSLNGEAKEIYKESVDLWKNTINDKNRVFRGTVVYSNSAYMKVTEVGEDTLFGKITHELKESQPPSPLKVRLSALAKVISRIGYVGAFLVSFSYLFSVIVINNNFDIELIRETIMNFPLITSYILYALNSSENTYYKSSSVWNNYRYAGRIKAYTILQAKEENEKIDISSAHCSTTAPQPFTGQPICPQVDITLNSQTLTKDVDYTITYRSNTNVGTAEIEITGIGSYTGTINLQFEIIPIDVPTKPNNKISIPKYATTLSDISLPTGWQWENPNLLVDNLSSATAVFVGENKDNYKNTTMQILLQKDNSLDQNPNSSNDKNNDINQNEITKTKEYIPIIIVFVGITLTITITLLIIMIKKKKNTK